MVLVFLDQTTISKENPDGSFAASGVKVGLKKINGTWLISSFDPCSPFRRRGVTKRKPADLVLSGGGVKGIGLVGAVVGVDGRGIRAQRVSGTSAGSIVGAIVAAASDRRPVSPSEVKELALQLDYQQVHRRRRR